MQEKECNVTTINLFFSFALLHCYTIQYSSQNQVDNEMSENIFVMFFITSGWVSASTYSIRHDNDIF